MVKIAQKVQISQPTDKTQCQPFFYSHSPDCIAVRHCFFLKAQIHIRLGRDSSVGIVTRYGLDG